MLIFSAAISIDAAAAATRFAIADAPFTPMLICRQRHAYYCYRRYMPERCYDIERVTREKRDVDTPLI